jgi:RNA-binding protein PNO1
MPKIRKEPATRAIRKATGPDGDASGFVARGGEKAELTLEKVEREVAGEVMMMDSADVEKRAEAAKASSSGSGASSSSGSGSAADKKARQAGVLADGKVVGPDGELVAPKFPALSAAQISGGNELRRVRVPPHRYTPLRAQWANVMRPVVEYLKLQIRMNMKTRSVELKTSEHTDDAGALQKGCDFLQAFMMGFEVQDAVALLRLDDLYIDSFVINDVKMLRGDHLSRAIGRLAGQSGKTRFAIENATRTRIIIADQKIHILGSFNNIKLARDAVCALIMGSPPGKVYNRMRTVAARMGERF